MRSLFRSFFRNESGTTAISYGSLLAVIAVGAFPALSAFNAVADSIYNQTSAVTDRIASKTMTVRTGGSGLFAQVRTRNGDSQMVFQIRYQRGADDR